MLVFTVHRKVHMHVYHVMHPNNCNDPRTNCREGHRGQEPVLSVLTVVTHTPRPAPSIRNVVRERASHIFLAQVELTARVRLQLGRLDRVDFCSEAHAAPLSLTPPRSTPKPELASISKIHGLSYSLEKKRDVRVTSHASDGLL